MSNSCTLFIDMTNVNISFEKNDKGGSRSVCDVLSISTLRDLSPPAPQHLRPGLSVETTIGHVSSR